MKKLVIAAMLFGSTMAAYANDQDISDEDISIMRSVMTPESCVRAIMEQRKLNQENKNRSSIICSATHALSSEDVSIIESVKRVD